MIDAVLSYHTDPMGCGVTKFSQQLAKRLGVPWGRLGDDWHKRPLVSVKFSELGQGGLWASCPNEELFIHDAPASISDAYKLTQARRVFAASESLAELVWPIRSDVIAAWCPSLVEAEPRQPITILSLGMAHKLRADLYATLKEKLDRAGEPYVVYVSAALHEGTTFSDAAQSFEKLRQLFGPNFVFLGTLSDEALLDKMRRSTYVAAFFQDGLRENNTSVNAALEAGATVISNFDDKTPNLYRGWVWDVRGDDLLFTAQRDAIRETFGWEPLVRLIRG